jgi:Protein of unknown function (DUF1579)
MKFAILLIAGCLLASLSSFVQAQPEQLHPAPTPQHQRMGYFAGNWTAEGMMKLSPKGNPAPFSLTETGEWVSNGFFLETRTSMTKSPMGPINSVRVMGYNPENELYAYNVYNSLGEHQIATGKVQGNTWTWTSEQKMNGIVSQARYTITAVTPDSYTFKQEVATPGGGWVTVMEGKASRAQ